jgi:hypothetical protein
LKARIVGVVVAVKAALVSKEARGPELALARIVLVALGAKLGYDFSHFV